MKTQKKHFDLFKHECLSWIDKFGLYEWEVYFTHTEMNDALSSITYTLDARVVTFRFAKSWTETIRPLTNKEVKTCAKHEVIHLLLAKLYSLAISRYVTSEQLDIENEELTINLMRVI